LLRVLRDVFGKVGLIIRILKFGVIAHFDDEAVFPAQACQECRVLHGLLFGAIVALQHQMDVPVVSFVARKIPNPGYRDVMVSVARRRRHNPEHGDVVTRFPVVFPQCGLYTVLQLLRCWSDIGAS
jgi:hypothetical protein